MGQMFTRQVQTRHDQRTDCCRNERFTFPDSGRKNLWNRGASGSVRLRHVEYGDVKLSLDSILSRGVRFLWRRKHGVEQLPYVY